MNYFKQFKTYFTPPTKLQPPVKQQTLVYVKSPKSSHVIIGSDSFELILYDILEDGQNQQKCELRKISQQFEDLVALQEEKIIVQQQFENMYVHDYIFIGDKCQGKQLTLEEWQQIIDTGNLSLQSKKNIYFSILKGINFRVRKQVWEVLANTAEMKKLSQKSYEELRDPSCTPLTELSIIDKDVPRSTSITGYLPELRSLLIAYVNFSGRGYTQGMNLIAGALLSLLALENDSDLKGWKIVEKQFQERVFWVFVGIMRWKKWQLLFQKDLSGLEAMLHRLQCLMISYVPRNLQQDNRRLWMGVVHIFPVLYYNPSLQHPQRVCANNLRSVPAGWIDNHPLSHHQADDPPVIENTGIRR